MQNRNISEEHETVFLKFLVAFARKRFNPEASASYMRSRFSKLDIPEAIPTWRLKIGDIEILLPLSESPMKPRQLADRVRDNLAFLLHEKSKQACVTRMFMAWMRTQVQNETKLPPDINDTLKKIESGDYVLNMIFLTEVEQKEPLLAYENKS